MKQLEVQQELELFKKRVIQQAKSNLTKMKKNASGNLHKNLKGEVTVFSTGNFALEFDLGKYGEFQDKGVSGKIKKYNTPFSYKSKMPPSRVFEKWIKQKGIKGRDMGYTKKDGTKVKGTGRFITNRTLSFIIARSIFNNGIKPSLFFTKPFENEYKKLSDDLVTAFGLDIDEFLKYTVNGTK
jgi:hypothetical protein